MNSFFYTSASGWIAYILTAVEILLPYLLRRSRLSEWLGIAAGNIKPYLQRMWPHYWAGYALVILSVVHAWIPMSGGHMGSANRTGLSIGTLALCLLLLQLLLGLVLQEANLESRALTRRWHYWIMLGLGFTATVHVWMSV